MDRDQVVACLLQAGSPNKELQLHAQSQLREWEVKAGFHAALADILCQPNANVQTEQRYTAAIVLKNNVERFWRPMAPDAIPADERAYVRGELLNLLREPHEGIAVMSAQLVGRIARIDAPQQWPELIPLLIELVQSSDPLVQQRSLLFLYRVEKALASRRLPPQRKAFAQLAEQLLPFLFSTYTRIVEEQLRAGSPGALNLQALTFARLLLKTIRQFVAWGVQVNAAHTYHPTQFARHLSVIVDFYGARIFPPADARHPLSSKFLTTAMLLLRDIIKAPDYQIEPRKEVQSEAALALQSALDYNEREQWETDPELFATEDIGDGWRYVMKPCAEHLYQALLDMNGDGLAPYLLSLMQEALAPTSSLTMKDAVYNAVALSAYALRRHLNINDVLGQLLQEFSAQTGSQDGTVLQRRILLLCRAYATINIAKEPRPAIYELLISTIGSHSDVAIRLTACATLKEFAQDVGFAEEDFLPLLKNALSWLFALLDAVEDASVKIHVLACITEVVYRMQDHLNDLSTALVEYLPVLWQQSQDHALLQTQIVRFMVTLIKAANVANDQLVQMSVPLIQYGTDLQQGGHVYLLDDVVILWHELLKVLPSLTDEVLGLYEALPTLLQQANDNVRTCILILESYLLFEDARLEQLYSHICASLPQLFATVPRSQLDLVTRVFQNALGLPGLAQGLAPFGGQLFTRIITEQSPDRPFTNAMISVTARFAVQYPDYFRQMVPSNDACTQFWATLCDHYDSMVVNSTKKLVVLTLANALNAYTGRSLNVNYTQESTVPQLTAIFGVLSSAILTFHFRGEMVLDSDLMFVELSEYADLRACQTFRQAKVRRPCDFTAMLSSSL
ncbi:uncharacterized protein MONBRDRAFT_26661 [Monosiga brevicollis MX1]|uniref:Importin N-terminal domain-containing protein n=1 Tax=Monosiga brevicollis TaxID=81824 RepID=A9V306_MONBE|nr:uncharacterized protein MONBRDRAFT_26661 [Monosiga brevicollis MX1]EDQ88103.1 predicted protein [Monosiga brevicollis MX1]|eukprot:XP_001747179.1 hypothetical protein [Monosiga brevicollis MX1]